MNDEVRSMWRVLVSINAVGLLITLLGIEWNLRWWSATLAAGIGFIVQTWWIVKRGLPRWSCNCWLFGISAGLAELAADSWLVRDIGVLTYAPGGPFVFSSPLYMPIAWGGTLQTLVVAGMWLRCRTRLVTAMVVTSAIAGLYLPFYEHFASLSGWWTYRGSHLLFGTTPSFIALGELLIGAPLPFFGAWLAQARYGAAALAGACIGAWIFVAYLIAFSMLG